MTFLNDIWKKFSETKLEKPSGSSSKTGEQALSQDEKMKPPQTPMPSSKSDQKKITAEQAEIATPEENKLQNNIDHILQAFQQVELEEIQKKSTMENLKQLKEIVDQPKPDTDEIKIDDKRAKELSIQFSKMNSLLTPQTQSETVRKERWPLEIHCPNCNSVQLKRLAQLSQNSPLKHRYKCMECGNTFNDDSDTPLAREIPPLNVWMQCWYLMGCTDSLNYIATRLDVELSIVEFMVKQLQKTFNAQKPLTRLQEFEEWSKQSQHLRNQLKEDLIKQYERLNANIATVPKDTQEFRRQQNLRRDLDASTRPPSPTIGGKRR